MQPVPGQPGAVDVGIGWYAAALVAYVGLGLLTKSVVLNWVVGPVFPLLVLYVLPRLLRRGRNP